MITWLVVTEVRSASAWLFAGTWRPLVSVITPFYYVVISCHPVYPPVRGIPHSIMLPLAFIIQCGIVRFLCAMRVFEVRASSSSPRLPLCQILFFFHGLHCWASQWRKIAHSTTQSLSQLIWCAGNQSACALEKQNIIFANISSWVTSCLNKLTSFVTFRLPTPNHSKWHLSTSRAHL